MSYQNQKKKKTILYGAYALLLFIIFLIQYSGNMPLSLGSASFSPVLPTVIAAAILFKEWAGSLFGLALGIAMDIVTNGSYCFNAVALMAICCIVGVVISRIFLNNNMSSIVLMILGVFAYYLSKWFFLCLLTENTEPFLYLWKITLPSALITTIFGIPWFFLLRFVARKIVK